MDNGWPGVTNVPLPPVPSTSFSATIPPVSKLVSNKFLPSKKKTVLNGEFAFNGNLNSADAFNKKYPGTF